tara:strand:- start:2191 stop:2616 length:426 start_codon:yes stop_codon:yes gene_type:complete
MKTATKQGRVAQAKEMNRQEMEDRNKAADEGRPVFIGDVNTKERLNKYVKVGLREDNLDDATKRSALHAVIQEGINKASGVDSKPTSVKELNAQARSRLANIGKWGLGGALYVMGRIMRPTKLGDSTRHGSYTYKKMGVQK